MSGAGLSTLYMFAQLIFSTAFEGHSYYFHFTDEKTGSEGELACLSSVRKWRIKDSNPGLRLLSPFFRSLHCSGPRSRAGIRTFSSRGAPVSGSCPSGLWRAPGSLLSPSVSHHLFPHSHCVLLTLSLCPQAQFSLCQSWPRSSLSLDTRANFSP